MDYGDWNGFGCDGIVVEYNSYKQLPSFKNWAHCGTHIYNWQFYCIFNYDFATFNGDIYTLIEKTKGGGVMETKTINKKEQTLGCFYCQCTYSSNAVAEWTDSGKTPLCPFCGVDSVVNIQEAIALLYKHRFEFPVKMEVE